ncbi:MAG: hypothetical protein QW101_03955 [Ignisphaera sp.]
MRKNRLILILLGSVCLLLLISSPVTLLMSLEMDPPSIYNSGFGGLERYVVDIMFSKNVEIIFRFSELHRFKPEEFSLLVVGPDEEIHDVEKIIDWVSKGGIAIVLDELNYTKPLMTRLGLSRGNMFNVIDVADCHFDGMQTKILVNVFTEVVSDNVDNLQQICRYNDIPIAVRIRYGRGMIVVVGDSSLVINDVYLKSPQWYRINSGFIRLLSMDRDIIIYEGSRRYSRITSAIIALVISNINNGIPDIINIVIGDSLMNRLISVIILMFVSVLYTVYRFGIPKYRIDESITFKYVERIDHQEFREKVRKGMLSWIKSIEK